MPDTSSFLGSLVNLFTQDPFLLASQFLIIFLAGLVLFLIFFTLRDILLRTHSFPYQFLCILLVAALPVVGFLLYIIIRPARSLAQRETDRQISDVWQQLCANETRLPVPIASSETIVPSSFVSPSPPAV